MHRVDQYRTQKLFEKWQRNTISSILGPLRATWGRFWVHPSRPVCNAPFPPHAPLDSRSGGGLISRKQYQITLPSPQRRVGCTTHWASIAQGRPCGDRAIPSLIEIEGIVPPGVGYAHKATQLRDTQSALLWYCGVRQHVKDRLIRPQISFIAHVFFVAGARAFILIRDEKKTSRGSYVLAQLKPFLCASHYAAKT